MLKLNNHRKFPVIILVVSLCTSCGSGFDSNASELPIISQTSQLSDMDSQISSDAAEETGISLYSTYDPQTESYGYINKTGEWIIQPQFTDASQFDFSITLAAKDEKNYLIDETGQLLYELPSYYKTSSHRLKGNLFPIHDTSIDSYGYINAKGETIIPFQFLYAGMFENGLALAKDRSSFLYGYIDTNGNWLIPPQFEEASSSWAEHLSVVKSEGKYGYINRDGNWEINPQYDKANGFSDGLAAVSYEGKFGYIDKTGKWIIEPAFDIAEDFCSGFAAVSVDSNYGVIDKTGHFTIAPEFGRIVLSEDGIQHGVISAHKDHIIHTPVITDYKVGLIDLQGNWITEPIFNSSPYFEDGLSYAEMGYFENSDTLKKGMIDYNGEWVIPPEYSTLHFQNGLIFFEKYTSIENGMAKIEGGYMTTKGEIVYKYEYFHELSN